MWLVVGHENIACVYSQLNRVTSTYPLSGGKIRGIPVSVYGGFLFVDESFLLEWGSFLPNDNFDGFL